MSSASSADPMASGPHRARPCLGSRRMRERALLAPSPVLPRPSARLIGCGRASQARQQAAVDAAGALHIGAGSGRRNCRLSTRAVAEQCHLAEERTAHRGSARAMLELALEDEAEEAPDREDDDVGLQRNGVV